MNQPWSENARRLRAWFHVYWPVAACGVLWLFVDLGDMAHLIGMLCFMTSFVLYVGCIVFSYRIQASLFTAGFTRTGRWVIAVSAVLLGPFLGFLIPFAVLSNVREIERRLRKEAGSSLLAQPAK